MKIRQYTQNRALRCLTDHPGCLLSTLLQEVTNLIALHGPEAEIRDETLCSECDDDVTPEFGLVKYRDETELEERARVWQEKHLRELAERRERAELERLKAKYEVKP